MDRPNGVSRRFFYGAALVNGEKEITHKARGVISLIAGCVLFVSCSQPSPRGSVEIAVNSELADYVVQTACSGNEIDETYLRNYRPLSLQIRHHQQLGDGYSLDAYLEGLRAVASCEVLDPDPFRFRYVVKKNEDMKAALAFLKEHSQEISDHVSASVSPYTPKDLNYSGRIILSAAGNSCGGFAMEEAFFIDVPCIAGAQEAEYEAIKMLAAHETYHALQNEFFAPASEETADIKTREDAQLYLLTSLLREGTAELAADSRQVTGDGTLAKIFSQFAHDGYAKLEENFQLLGSMFELVNDAEDGFKERAEEAYAMGLRGDVGQPIYFVGASMAREIEADFGVDTLVCVIAKPPEQFVLAYAHARDHGQRLDTSYAVDGPPLSAARQIAAQNGREAAFQECL